MGVPKVSAVPEVSVVPSGGGGGGEGRCSRRRTGGSGSIGSAASGTTADESGGREGEGAGKRKEMKPVLGYDNMFHAPGSDVVEQEQSVMSKEDVQRWEGDRMYRAGLTYTTLLSEYDREVLDEAIMEHGDCIYDWLEK